MRLVTQHGATITSAIRERLLNEGVAWLVRDSNCVALLEALCADTEIKDAALLAALKPETVKVVTGIRLVIPWV